MNDKQLKEALKSVEEFVEAQPIVRQMREVLKKQEEEIKALKRENEYWKEEIRALKRENEQWTSKYARLKRDGFAALYGARRLGYEQAKGALPPHCPKCARQMSIKTNTHTGGKFWGCNWPKCWGARDWPDAARDRGRLIVEESHPLIGGPADGRRIPVQDGIDTLHVPIPRTFSSAYEDPIEANFVGEARYRKMYFQRTGVWAWVYDGLDRDEVEALLLAGYGVTP